MPFSERIRGFLPSLRYEGPQVCCAARVTMEVADGISRRENPQQIAERLKKIEGVTAGLDELREALLREQVLSEIVSVNRLNEIVSAASHKSSSTQKVLNLLRGVHTCFDVHRVIAREGGISALGFSRVVAYDVLPGGKLRATSQWFKKDGQILETPYRDSFFAEGRAPLPGEAMDEVLKTGKAVLVQNPAEDDRCKVRPAQNPGPFMLVPGNGQTIYMFDTLAADRTIHPEDIELLESLVKVGVETKHRIVSQRRVRNEQISHRTRELVSRQANDIPDLRKILLISVTFNFHVNMAAIFMRVPRTNKYEGIFGLGSLTEEEHQQALDNLGGVRTEEDVLAVVQSHRRVDQPLNKIISSMVLEGELEEAVVARGGRFYKTNGEEYVEVPPLARQFLDFKDLPAKAKDFVLLPVGTRKTTYGFLYLANPWTGRDIDLDGIGALNRDFMDLLRVMRRQTDPPASTGGVLPLNRDQLLGILRRAFTGVSDTVLAAREYLDIIRSEAREAGNEKDLREMTAMLAERFNMPEGFIKLEMPAGMEALLEKDWIGAALEAGVIEALQAMQVGFNPNGSGLCYGSQDWVLVKIEGDTIVFEVLEEKMGEGVGVDMLKLLDAEIRGQGVGGIRVRAEGKRLIVRLQNLQKK